jgi:hypothetical protein
MPFVLAGLHNVAIASEQHASHASQCGMHQDNKRCENYHDVEAAWALLAAIVL